LLLAQTPLGFVLLISVATFGHGCWATTTQTIPGDIVAPRFLGTVYGMTAFGGGIGAILFMCLTGRLVDTSGSFTAPFVIAGLLPLAGYGVFALLARQKHHAGQPMMTFANLAFTVTQRFGQSAAHADRTA